MSHFLSMDPFTNPCFKGFAMRDASSLPGLTDIYGANRWNLWRGPYLYILNTDVTSGKGEHWCVAFLDKLGGLFEFFDPYGFSPAFHGFEHLLAPHCTKGIYSPTCVQGLLSSACGCHCLLFSWYRCRRYDMNKILNLYDENDMKRNDDMAIEFVEQFGKRYKIKL